MKVNCIIVIIVLIIFILQKHGENKLKYYKCLKKSLILPSYMIYNIIGIVQTFTEKMFYLYNIDTYAALIYGTLTHLHICVIIHSDYYYYSFICLLHFLLSGNNYTNIIISVFLLNHTHIHTAYLKYSRVIQLA